MKKIVIGLAACGFSGLALANCPDSLNAEKMVECITIEGAGANYQDWSKAFYNVEILANSESIKSPITGTDIRTIKPAAGK